MLSASHNAITKDDRNDVARLKPNPAWLPLDPNQRMGHEAPARLNSPQLAVDPTVGTADGKGDKKKKGKAKAKNQDSTIPSRGKVNDANHPDPQRLVEVERKFNNMNLRTLKSKEKPVRPMPDAPKTPKAKKPQDREKSKKSNLQDGTPAVVKGKVWRGNNNNDPPVASGSEASAQAVDPIRASHFGAPVQEIKPESRIPSRPQNLAAYKDQLAKGKQQEESKAKGQTEAVKAASKAGTLPVSPQGSKSQQNLAKFNALYPVQGNSLTIGRSAEAPARMSSGAQAKPPTNEPPPVPAVGVWTPKKIPKAGDSSPEAPSSPTPQAPRPASPIAGPSTPPQNVPQRNPASNAGPSQVVAGPSTPPQDAPRRNPTRKSKGKKLRRRLLQYALEQELASRDLLYHLDL